MQNHIYLVGCATTRECYAVDACWDTVGIASYAKRHKMRLVGAIGTHYHCARPAPPCDALHHLAPPGSAQRPAPPSTARHGPV